LLYELPIFEHADATTIEEAVSLLTTYGEKARIMAGGTDLLALMKDRINGPQMRVPEVLINVKSISGMTRMTDYGNRNLRIGCAVTLNDLEGSETVRRKYKLLWEAARQVGTTQIRFLGTVGGNLCQRPRCLYFRHPDFFCYKKGGGVCYALGGEHRYYHSIVGYGRCAMAHPSDLAPALIALNATVVIAARDGEREVSLEDLFLQPNHLNETVLRFDELLKEVRIPDSGEENYQQFLKRRVRHAADFSLSSVAIFGRFTRGAFEEIRIVLGGIAPCPWRAFHAEETIHGKPLGDGIISKAADEAVREAKPLRMNAYKVDLTKALVRRALSSIWEEAIGRG